ncbi:hypothetical protein C8J57DRAFT_1194924 [Mycena rebaudengoi]|nr:hypothetical protein C8J57DRAFT_1194924 [Mycena rebaudengoi]
MPSPQTLPPTTKGILDQCPRFRVLVVGKSGAGKSALINHAFGIDKNSVSHQERGVCNINDEITSTQNERFVVHDSMGFEPGQLSNFEMAKEFLKSRSGDGIALKDRVHVIWLCMHVSVAGQRMFETGDEEFLKIASAFKVPTVVVFTQFDKLVDRMEQDLTDEEEDMPEEEIALLCLRRADAEFQKICVGPLQRIDPTLRYERSSGLAGQQNSNPDRRALDRLIRITQILVEDAVTAKSDMDGAVPIISAMAQRASVRVKIDASIKVGMKRYWKGLAAGTNFMGFKFENCLATIHQEITDIWWFNDPDNLLNGAEFQDKMKIVAQLVTPEEPGEVNSWFKNLEGNQTLLGFGTTAVVAAVAGPAIAGIGLSVLFIQWAAKAYEKTPGSLRCFMAYIVDLTLIMEQLFLMVLSMNPRRALTEKDITKATENCKSTIAGVHREIRQYVNKASFGKILRSNKAEEKVWELIKRYCLQYESEDASA